MRQALDIIGYALAVGFVALCAVQIYRGRK